MKIKKCGLAFLTLLPIVFFLAGCGSKKKAANPAVKPNQSQVVTTTMYSKKMHLDWNYDVYLPAGYDPNGSKKYPVLYMLHGVNGNHRNLLERFNSQQILDGLVHRKNKKMIVVFLDGFNSFYVNQKDGLPMEDAIVHDMVPTINKLYKTKTDPDHTAIGGISMGGYGAARFVLKYPNLFGKAVLISPSVWYNLPNTNPIKMSMHAFTDGKKSWSDKVYQSLFPTNYLGDQSAKSKFFVETTSSDTTVPVKDVNRFVKKLQSNNISVKYVKDSGDNHNWTYWAKAAPNAYNWALDEMN